MIRKDERLVGRAKYKTDFLALVFIVFPLTGCATLFGWDIHAPGILSESFAEQIQPVNARVGLYIEPQLAAFISTDRGSKTADPQTFHVGEALAPMLVEAFQETFSEFIFLETEPTPRILKRYAIPYLATVRIKDFKNHVTWKGQAVQLTTETLLLDPDLQPLAHFESTGSSDAEKVFPKKGGPEVNLNAAAERNILAIIQFLSDVLKEKTASQRGAI